MIEIDELGSAKVDINLDDYGYDDDADDDVDEDDEVADVDVDEDDEG